MQTYVTSDLHLCHDKNFLFGPRGYSSVEHWNRDVVKIWNRTVDEDDTVYVLGDIMLNNNAEGMRIWNQLKGQKKIILGNHDSFERIRLYDKAPNTEVIGYSIPLNYRGYKFFLSHYPTITCSTDVNKPLKNKTINLCGHTHTSDPWADWDKGVIYHVEWDAHGGPKPLDDIIEELKEEMGNG